MEKIKDVEVAEAETAESSSDENKAADPVSEVKKTEASEGVKTPETEEGDKGQKTVPYDRFQEVVKQRNQYKELMDATKPEVEKTVMSEKDIHSQARELAEQTGESYDDALKIVKDIVDKTVGTRINELNRKLELDRVIDKNSDFFNYAEQVKSEIKNNPALSWEQAYKLVKFDVAQSEAQTKARDEAQKSVAKKQAASVETASKSKSSPNLKGQAIEDIDFFAKGPDGEYLYSTEEIETLLPKEKNE